MQDYSVRTNKTTSDCRLISLLRRVKITFLLGATVTSINSKPASIVSKNKFFALIVLDKYSKPIPLRRDEILLLKARKFSFRTIYILLRFKEVVDVLQMSDHRCSQLRGRNRTASSSFSDEPLIILLCFFLLKALFFILDFSNVILVTLLPLRTRPAWRDMGALESGDVDEP